ncbi:hypothetical protein KQX54_003997 [Cotesia glomerata]|uniref:ZSWIM1/3 RNaseH-like domain-containing protein n=1 Tax=Cotesia glomerata TaxID=32391 RepID=A0AAV7J3Z6_COTGL|nr:hypothetical protein KQX54_003997 [Cotesia glomerata]
MRSSFRSWPEVVFLDGTYKLFNTNSSFMILLIDDSNGLSELAGAAILANKDYASMKWFLETFKNENADALLEDVHKCFKSGFDIDIKEVDSLIKANYLQLPNVSTGYKIKTVFEKRKVIKILTDNIYQSSTLWLLEN